tara:strand:- start:56 stop:310 length:255 start_codon:yes stop_codon:yes gene_type:complete
MPKKSIKKKTIKRRLSKSHKEKIALGLRKYHKSCKKSKSKSKSKSKTDTDIKEFLEGIKTASNKSNKKKLRKEVEKLREMINKN